MRNFRIINVAFFALVSILFFSACAKGEYEYTLFKIERSSAIDWNNPNDSKKHANVYASPSYDAKIIGRIKNGEKVQTNYHPDDNDQWLAISFEGKTGYIRRMDTYLKRIVTKADDYLVRLENLNDKVSLSIKPGPWDKDYYNSGKYFLNELWVALLHLIAFFLFFITKYLTKIKRKGGWISGLCAISLGYIILLYTIIRNGMDCIHMWFEFFIGIIIACVLYLSFAYLMVTSTHSVLEGIGRTQKKIEENGKSAIWIAVVGFVMLILDGIFQWHATILLLVLFVVGQLLCCIYFFKNFKVVAAIAITLLWLICSFTFMNMLFLIAWANVALAALLAGVLILYLILNFAVAGPALITASGTVLRATIFGLRDGAGQLWHLIGNKVIKDSDL